jgi:hypothetical protein
MRRVRRFAVVHSLLLSGFFTSFTLSATVAAPLPNSTLAPSSAKVTITKHPGTVRRGATASVTIKTAAKAACSFTVRYKSGPSTAQGLGPK